MSKLTEADVYRISARLPIEDANKLLTYFLTTNEENEQCENDKQLYLARLEYYESETERLTEENRLLNEQLQMVRDHSTSRHMRLQRYKRALLEAETTLQEVAGWGGQNLGVANWHMNGDLEPLDGFIDSAEIHEMLDKIQDVLRGDQSGQTKIR